MELGWTGLAVLVLGTIVVWFWQDSLAARELANAAAIDACNRLSLQFLDGTVAFAGLKLVRGTRSVFRVQRTYVFDYTANSIERRQGFVVLTGRRVDSVGFARGEEHRAATVPTEHHAIAPPPSSSKVLSIEEWRARQRTSGTNTDQNRHNGTHAGE